MAGIFASTRDPARVSYDLASNQWDSMGQGMSIFRRRREPIALLPSPQICDYIAIDFETANATRGSACAIGVAVVRDGRIVDEGASLIDPEAYFSPYNVAVNGIDEEAVAGAPTFGQLWPDLTKLLDSQLVVAHNASFDCSVLRASAARYGVDYGPACDIACTYRMAKFVWQGLPSYSLGYLAPELGIEFNHHVASEDARACAEIALASCRILDAPTLRRAMESLGFTTGRLTSDSYIPIHLPGTGTGKLAAAEGREDADPTHPLYGKSICFTGAMASMLRREAMERVTEVGCDFKNSISKKLTYLVIGDGDFVSFADGYRTGKLTRAMELRDEGAAIEIIPERDFLELLLS